MADEKQITAVWIALRSHVVAVRQMPATVPAPREFVGGVTADVLLLQTDSGWLHARFQCVFDEIRTQCVVAGEELATLFHDQSIGTGPFDNEQRAKRPAGGRPLNISDY